MLKQTEIRYVVYSGVNDPSDITFDELLGGVESLNEARHERDEQDPSEGCKIYKGIISVDTFEVD